MTETTAAMYQDQPTVLSVSILRKPVLPSNDIDRSINRSREVQERIRYISEKGKEILLVDSANCPPSEVADIARTVPNHLATQPRSSVLLLVNFTGASFDQEAIRAIKESAVFDKPYIKKSAWIGNIQEELHA